VEDIVRRSWVDLDFTFGYESLLGKANPLRITLTITEVKYNCVYVDKSKIERAWINLASNALEFANTSVDVKAERLSDDLIIRVVDDGIGVPADFIPRLFQRGASHGKSDGTGLGLAYVKQVMMGPGGDVR
ncbi:MAG: sensor histidine kinase, partial [bacterium]